MAGLDFLDEGVAVDLVGVGRHVGRQLLAYPRRRRSRPGFLNLPEVAGDVLLEFMAAPRRQARELVIGDRRGVRGHEVPHAGFHVRQFAQEFRVHHVVRRR